MLEQEVIICGLSNSGNSHQLEWPSRSFTYWSHFWCDFSYDLAL